MIPIVLTAYNRVGTLTKTMDSLLKCDGIKGRKIIVYQDGHQDKDNDGWVFTEAYLHNCEAINPNIIKVYRPNHLGLRGNSLFAIEDSLKKYDKIIYLQDDQEFTKDFLTFMDAALNKFEDRKDIMFVSGYSHISWGACYLSPLTADGLGIWRWKFDLPLFDYYKPTPEIYKDYAKETTPSFASYLKDIIEGRSDAFMALLSYTMYLNKARCMHPNVNKVRYCVSDSTNSKKKDAKRLNNDLYIGFSNILDETEMPYEIIKKTKNYRWSLFKKFTRWMCG